MEQTNKQKLGWTAKKKIFPDECTKRKKKKGSFMIESSSSRKKHGNED